MYPICCLDCGYYIGCTKRKYTGQVFCKDCCKKKDATNIVISRLFEND